MLPADSVGSFFATEAWAGPRACPRREASETAGAGGGGRDGGGQRGGDGTGREEGEGRDGGGEVRTATSARSLAMAAFIASRSAWEGAAHAG